MSLQQAPLELTFGIMCKTVIVPEVQGNPGNYDLVAAISFSKIRRYHRRSNQQIWKMWDHSHFLVTKNCCTEKPVYASSPVSTTVPTFSVDLLPQMLQQSHLSNWPGGINS
jgi:hypothetical protein